MSTPATRRIPEPFEETPQEKESETPAPTKPPGVPEFSVRAVVTAMFVAAVIGGSYPYVVMKLGFGPNISVVSAFFGYLALGLVFRNFNRWENNIVQTAGTSAGQTAFLCVLMAAFDMLRTDPTLGFTVALTPMQSFWWLTTAGVMGVLLAVPMRRHYIVDEKLTFADGVAVAETLVVLDSRSSRATSAARSLGIGTAVSALLMVIREDAQVVAHKAMAHGVGLFEKIRGLFPLPEMTVLGGPTSAKMGVGVGYSLLSLGSGMLIGMRINTSMLLGTLGSWVIAPLYLTQYTTRKEILLWVMWPATGMLVAGGLTALFLRWRVLAKTFRQLSSANISSDDFPMRWVIGGVAITSIALVVVQKVALGTPVWMTLVAVLLSLPLMLVGLRVLGETNWGPISALSNMMQGIFGLLAPGHIGANMTASGVTGSIAVQSEGLMQDYKTGHIIGSSPKYLTYAQLLAVPVGAAAVATVYPLLYKTYGIGGDHGLSSPISAKWAGFAKLLSQGLSALPPGALAALGVGVVVGILLTVLESTRHKKWTLSPTGLGIGMLVPASAIVTMFLGGVVAWVWGMIKPKQAEVHVTPLASGFIAGEAIVAVVVPVLIVLGLL